LRVATITVRRGNSPSAIADYEAALQLDPRCYAACQKLAWLMATSRDDSVRQWRPVHWKLAEQAAQIHFVPTPSSLSTLAAAHAELGDFKQAVELETQARKLITHAANNPQRLNSYTAGKPLRGRSETFHKK